jgi:predicted nucleotidyltransferase component of viral defense system
VKLHEDTNAFRVLINDIHEKTGYRLDVLEKDYYVVLMLEELSKLQDEGLPAYFKGGTALYKALHTTNRFSEDIDLSVDTRDCSRTQNDKRLEKATKKYTSLERQNGEGYTNRSEVVSVYSYKPVTDYDKDDELQRFGKLKIEATSFTISEPVTHMFVAAMIYELATKEQRQILEDMYDVRPFSVQTITMERIFVDKLFAAEAYVRKSEIKGRAFEAAKHIYDLAVMSKLPKIKELMANEEQMKHLLTIRMTEELDRLDGIPGVTPSQFTFFEDVKNNQNVVSTYGTMQRQYVLRECDRIPYENALDALYGIKQALMKNNAWNKAVIPIIAKEK